MSTEVYVFNIYYLTICYFRNKVEKKFPFCSIFEKNIYICARYWYLLFTRYTR